MFDYIYSREYIQDKGHWNTENPEGISLAQTIKNNMGLYNKTVFAETECKISFVVELTTQQKSTLDTLVDNYKIASSQVKSVKPEDTLSIIGQIFKSAEQTTQAPRLMNVFDVNLTFYVALEDENYPLAIIRVQKMLNEGKITEDDYNLILSCIPQ